MVIRKPLCRHNRPLSQESTPQPRECEISVLATTPQLLKFVLPGLINKKNYVVSAVLVTDHSTETKIPSSCYIFDMCCVWFLTLNDQNITPTQRKTFVICTCILKGGDEKCLQNFCGKLGKQLIGKPRNRWEDIKMELR